MTDFYEDQQTLYEYLVFHYGTPELLMPWSFGPQESVGFPERIAHLFQKYYPKTAGSHDKLRALDVGCAVGRSSLELSKHFDEVIGIDFSEAFVQAAKNMARAGSSACKYRIQGEQFQDITLRLPTGVLPEKVDFMQGDAMQLAAMELGNFDLILASNLICRLPDPSVFLKEVAGMLSENGVFVLSTPYTYLESYTAVNRWLGGQKNAQTAEEAVFSRLSEQLELLDKTDTPMLIREHQRKYQWTVCQVSVWKRRGS